MFRAQSTEPATQSFIRDPASPFSRFYETGISRRPSLGRIRAQSEGPSPYGYRYSRAPSSSGIDEDIYGRSRARSVDPYLGFGRKRGFYDYLFGHRSPSKTHFVPSRSAYYDRYTELASGGRVNRPIIDGYYNHFRPYYWYSTAPRTVSYFYPFSDWRYTPRYHSRSPALYSFSAPDHSYIWRLHNAIDSAKSLAVASRAASSGLPASERSRASSLWPGFYNRLNPYGRSTPFSLICV